jgi:hypothetical protein
MLEEPNDITNTSNLLLSPPPGVAEPYVNYLLRFQLRLLTSYGSGSCSVSSPQKAIFARKKFMSYVKFVCACEVIPLYCGSGTGNRTLINYGPGSAKAKKLQFLRLRFRNTAFTLIIPIRTPLTPLCIRLHTSVPVSGLH